MYTGFMSAVKEILEGAKTISNEALALVIVSDVREAVLWELNPAGKSYSQIQEGVNERLHRQVSDGSLTWHLEKLKGSNLIIKRESLWFLTNQGAKILKILKAIAEANRNK